MTSDPSIERRVARRENDVDSIYEILTEHTRRFDGIDARLDRIDARLDGHDARFDGVDAQLGDIRTTLTEVLRRLPEPS